MNNSICKWILWLLFFLDAPLSLLLFFLHELRLQILCWSGRECTNGSLDFFLILTEIFPLLSPSLHCSLPPLYSVSLCSSAWPSSLDLPSSASWVLELQVCTAMFGYYIIVLIYISLIVYDVEQFELLLPLFIISFENIHQVTTSLVGVGDWSQAGICIY